MKKYLLWTFLAISPLQSFDKGEEFFEKKEYLEATKAFLTEAPVNDVRIYAYLDHMNQQGLVKPADLGEPLCQVWAERLSHVPYVPLGFGMGDIHLSISLLAQNFYTPGQISPEEAMKSIQKLSEINQLGFGYHILGRYLELNLPTDKPKKKLQYLLQYFEAGASFAHIPCILTYGRLATEHETEIKRHKIKLKKQYLKEAEILSVQIGAPRSKEEVLASFYLTVLPGNMKRIFQPDKTRHSFLNIASARQGNANFQYRLKCHAESHRMTDEFNFIRDMPNEDLYWGYFASLGGSPNALSEMGMCFMGLAEDSPFPVNPREAVVCFDKVFEHVRGNPSSCVEVFYINALRCAGGLYDKGMGDVPIDDVKALQCLQKAADLYGDGKSFNNAPSSQINAATTAYNLACFLEKGRGMSAPDLEAAKKYYNMASTLGDGKSSKIIAEGFLFGLPPYKKNPGLACAFLKRAEGQGDLRASHYLYHLFNHSFPPDNLEENDYPFPKDIIEAKRHLKICVQGGLEEAFEHWLIMLFHEREKLPDDEARMLVSCLTACLEKSNEYISAKAMLLRDGYRDLVLQDSQKAFELFEVAASQNDLIAISCLGHYYERGMCGIPQSYERAAQYYSQSLSLPTSLVNLGFIHEKGFLGKKNIDEAIRLYELAYQMDSGPAAYNLGALYQNGWHGKRAKEDHETAIQYYKQGWIWGDPDAAYQYAFYLYEGKHCKKNKVLAREILSSLDPENIEVAYSLSADSISRGDDKGWDAMAKCASRGFTIAEYVFGLRLYQNALKEDHPNPAPLVAQAVKYLKAASMKNMSAATSALRILERNAQKKSNNEDLGRIFYELFKGNIEGARAATSEAQLKKRQPKAEPIDLEADEYLQTLQSKDEIAAQERQVKLLERFLDPDNRKSITPKDLKKIMKGAIAEKGGYDKPTKGSGRKMKVGNQVLGYHNKHRSNQSSNATLDPGRAGSFRKFAKEVHEDLKKEKESKKDEDLK
ncbi:MAG: hypothetical protein K2Y18_05330 [Alphaproteobacteria bacterium]|jgi:TPR repeat protein|nr:hypothetical protein [Alphaproteobacteria bacterium]